MQRFIPVTSLTWSNHIFAMMNKFIPKIIIFLAAFLSTGNAALCQELPEWVMEMRKPVVYYPRLINSFNTYWSDKMEEDREEVEGEDDEEFNFPIKPEYNWLKFYLRQYFQVVRLQQNLRIDNPPFEKISSNPSLFSGNWKCAGPFSPPQDPHNVWGYDAGTGRINQLAFSGTNPARMFALAPEGLFISNDTANTWNITGTDFIGYHSLLCFDVDPLNDSVIYIGVGDYYFNPSHWWDSGILKSTDMGKTFTALHGGMDSTLISVIHVNPLNTNEIIAGGFTGIYKSSDAGATWQHTFSMYDSTLTGHWIYDIKYKPGSSDTLYATTDKEFYISNDGGVTWNQGFSNFQFSNLDGKLLLLGVTPAAPDYVYIATLQDYGNIYKSVDGGASFTATKKFVNPGLTGYAASLGSLGQGWYDFAFHADPLDSLTLYYGSIFTHKSTDGGVTWNTAFGGASQLHPDQHYVARNPLLPGRMWFANDGGVYFNEDTSAQFIACQQNLVTTQAYHFDADNLFDASFAFGTQDNGASYTNNGTDFTLFLPADVYANVYCAYNNSAAIFTSDYADISSHNVNLQNPPSVFPNALPEVSSNEPMSLTPVTPLTGFLANTHIWETNNMNGTPVSWRVIYNNTSGNNFTAVNHCLADSNVLYAVRYDGYLFRSMNALDAQPLFDSVPVPPIALWAVSIVTVPNNPDVVYLCSNDVYYSDDRGITWTNISSGILSIYNFREMVADPYADDGSVYLMGTNRVFYKNDSTPWITYSDNLPDIAYLSDIAVKKYNSQVRKLWVSVFGRGIWSSPVFQDSVTAVNENVQEENQLIVYPVPSNGIIHIESMNNGIQDVLIYNQNGQLIRRLENKINKLKVTFSLSDLAEGIYFIEVKTSKGFLTKKILIRK